MDSRALRRVIVALEGSGVERHLGYLNFDDGMISFELNPEVLGDPVTLGPDVQMFEGRQYPAKGHANFGFLSDSSPDRWGRLLMKRRAAFDDTDDKRTLSEWDYLLRVQDLGRTGAIRLLDPDTGQGLDNHPMPIPNIVKLRELEQAALGLDDATRRGDLEAMDTWLKVLVAPGSSLGGARPKANLVAPDGGLMIAKFPSLEDDIDVGLWEYLYIQLADEAGIEPAMAKRHRFTSRHHTFVTRRFDRDSQGRVHYLSAMTLTGKVDGQAGSYLDILTALDTYGDPDTLKRDRSLLFRRMLFNVMAGNRDDHLRNHGFLVSPKGVRLCPAFDMNPAPDKPEHAISIDEHQAAPSIDLAMSTSAYYDVTSAEANRICRDLNSVLAQWDTKARQLGLSAADIQLVTPAMTL